MEWVLDLPVEIISKLAYDLPTILNLEIEVLKANRNDLFLLLEKKRKSFRDIDILKYLLRFKNEDGFFPVVEFKIMYKDLLATMTPPKKCATLFELGELEKAFGIYQSFNQYSLVHSYLTETYREQLFRHYIEAEMWEMIRDELSRRSFFLTGYRIIKTLPEEIKRKVRNHLDDNRNLAVELMIDPEDTNLEDWTDELILNWIRDAINEGIIHQFGGFETSINFVRFLIYYVHEDPRCDQLPDASQFRFLLSPDISPTPTSDDPLLLYRGDASDFEQALEMRIFDEFGNFNHRRFTSMEQLRDDEDNPFIIDVPLSIGIVLAQFPHLFDKFLPHLIFYESSHLYTYAFASIFDLISYISQLDSLQRFCQKMSLPEEAKGWFQMSYGIVL